MARFVTLYSGSSGNSAYVGGRDAGILVDVGSSCRRTMKALEESQIELDAVKAIFITHEHSDHISGLQVFLSKHNVPVYASPEVAAYLADSGKLPAGTTLCEIGGEPVCEAGMMIESFDTPHDSLHSLGFRINTSDGRRIAIATDLGHLLDGIMKLLYGCDLVMIESNYDPEMLEFGPYPYMLKRRIFGRNGHLSNSECAAALPSLIASGTTRLVLAHLSKENNTPEVARSASSESLFSGGFSEGSDYLLEVAPRFCAGKPIIL